MAWIILVTLEKCISYTVIKNEVNIMTYIKFSTQTSAIKAGELLKRNSISVTVKRNPKPDRREGCNFAVFVNGEIERALKILDSAGIRYLGTDSFG